MTRSAAAELAELVRDPRRATWAPRHTSLLVTEIQALEALLANIVPNSPDRPLILRRLADDYYELKSAAHQDKQRALRSARATTQEVNKSEKLANAAEKKSLQYYEMLVAKHPDHCRVRDSADPSKNQGCLDDVLYFLGLEYQRLDTPDQARKYFFQLIKSFPMSPWIPASYLAFGEFFLAESAADPSKLEFARQAYDKVLQFPPPANETYGFAHYRLAQVHTQKQDFSTALAHMTKAAEFSANYSVLRSSELLGAVVCREIVPIYAQTGTPRKAEAFFKRLTNDPPGVNERLVTMLDGLVMAYLHENKRVEAADVCYAFSGGSTALPSCGQLIPPGIQPNP